MACCPSSKSPKSPYQLYDTTELYTNKAEVDQGKAVGLQKQGFGARPGYSESRLVGENAGASDSLESEMRSPTCISS